MPGGPYTLDQDVLLFNIALEKAEHDLAQAKTLAPYNLCQAMTGGTASYPAIENTTVLRPKAAAASTMEEEDFHRPMNLYKLRRRGGVICIVTRSVLKMVHSGFVRLWEATRTTVRIKTYVGGFMQAGDFVTIAEVSSYLHSDTITAHGGFGPPPSQPLITAGQAMCPLHCNVASSGWQSPQCNHGL